MGWIAELGADGFARVFDDYKVVARCEVAEGVHVGGDAEGVDYQDGAGSWGEDVFDGGGSEVEGNGVDVREDGRSANMQDGVGYCDEGEGRDDDFVAFPDAEGEQGHVQAGGSAADGDGVGDGVVCGECGFERVEFGAEAEVRSAQDCGDGVDFGFGDVGGGERNVRDAAPARFVLAASSRNAGPSTTPLRSVQRRSG